MTPPQAVSHHPFSPANHPELAPQLAFIPAASQAERLAGSENSWHSRSWSNIHCHRAGPAGSRHSWPAPAGRCTPCPGPWTERLVLRNKRERAEAAPLPQLLTWSTHTQSARRDYGFRSLLTSLVVLLFCLSAVSAQCTAFPRLLLTDWIIRWICPHCPEPKSHMTALLAWIGRKER